MAEARVRVEDGGEDAVEGAPKLHGVEWGKWDGILVDVVEGVVNDGAGSPVVLGYDAQGAEPEVLQLRHHSGRQNCPLRFVDHRRHLLPEEGDVVEG